MNDQAVEAPTPAERPRSVRWLSHAPLCTIVLAWLCSTIMYVQPGALVPDGVGYFAYLPSTYFDHDLLFFDEWAKFGLIRGSTIRFKDVTSSDHLSNHWTVGPAVVWYPANLAGDLLTRDSEVQSQRPTWGSAP